MSQRPKIGALTGIFALLLLGGLVAGMYTNAGAHVTNNVEHLWKQHIRPKADKRYVPRYFAAVNTDGSLARRAGVAASDNLSGAGSYEVIFRRNVRSCAYLATIGSADIPEDQPAAGFIGVADRTGTPRGVYVQTYRANGNEADRPFHIDIVC